MKGPVELEAGDVLEAAGDACCWTVACLQATRVFACL